MLRVLPTDKFGNVYYGPTNVEEGKREIERLNEEYWVSPGVVIGMMRKAGYVDAADQLTKEFLD